MSTFREEVDPRVAGFYCDRGHAPVMLGRSAVLVWRWRTAQDPDRPHPKSTTRGHAALARRIAHPLAGRVGQRCRLLAQGSNGNRLVEFEDGFRTVAPLYATRVP
jgi:hypothetical protein